MGCFGPGNVLDFKTNFDLIYNSSKFGTRGFADYGTSRSKQDEGKLPLGEKYTLDEVTRLLHTKLHDLIPSAAEIPDSFASVGGGIHDKNSHVPFDPKSVNYESSFNNILSPSDVIAKNRIGYVCRKGNKPGPNQDDYACIVWKIPGQDASEVLLGVFDGHGENGHIISNLAQKLFPRLLLQHQYYKTDPEKALEETYTLVESAIESIAERSCRRKLVKCSGTTATLALCKDNKLYLSHVGDSRGMYYSCVMNCIHGHPLDSSLSVNETEISITHVELTNDHNPTRLDERARIEMSGGEVKQESESQPFRVYKKNKSSPGLAMSRALGDLEAQKYGVSYSPEIKVIELPTHCADQCTGPSKHFVVLASDGVWDVLNSDDISKDILSFYQSGEKVIAESIAAHAIAKYKELQIPMIDDITVLVHYLK